MIAWLKRNRRTASWGLVGPLGALLLWSSTSKITHHPALVERFQDWGLRDETMLPIGLVELLSVVLYVVPRTSSLGVLLLTGYFGGAIAVHVVRGDSFLPPALILALVWAGKLLRNPEMFASFTKGRTAQSPAAEPEGDRTRDAVEV